jgi:hypothetical protein
MPENYQNPNNLIRYVLPKNSSKYFGSLIIHPEKAHFAFQKKTEKVYILAREHFITNIGWIFRTILLLIIPFLLISFGEYFASDFVNNYIFQDNIFKVMSPITLIALIFLYYSFIFSYAWTNYITWFYNVYLITNERMLHTNFKLLTGTRVIEAALDNIVDISQENYGLMPSLFNYGNVHVQTATAMRSKFNFHRIPDPSWFRSVLYELIKVTNGGEP